MNPLDPHYAGSVVDDWLCSHGYVGKANRKLCGACSAPSRPLATGEEFALPRPEFQVPDSGIDRYYPPARKPDGEAWWVETGWAVNPHRTFFSETVPPSFRRWNSPSGNEPRPSGPKVRKRFSTANFHLSLLPPHPSPQPPPPTTPPH